MHGCRVGTDRAEVLEGPKLGAARSRHRDPERSSDLGKAVWAAVGEAEPQLEHPAFLGRQVSSSSRTRPEPRPRRRGGQRGRTVQNGRVEGVQRLRRSGREQGGRPGRCPAQAGRQLNHRRGSTQRLRQLRLVAPGRAQLLRPAGRQLATPTARAAAAPTDARTQNSA